MENTYVGPFLIVKKLGNRRQKVYHARQTEQDRDVVLKFISLPPTVEWSKALDKIQREVNELQKLKHDSLVRVYGAGVYEDRIFFATELIEGEALSSILSRRGRITPDLVVEYGRQIAEVLRFLHSQDLVHSKLTPEKILVTSDHQIKISDLRLNRSKRRRWDATRRRSLDIAAYMAPEQFTEGATPKSDFYSLGVILFEMLTGKLPYEPDTMRRMTKMKMNAPVPSPATHVMNCPIWLDQVITQMLSPNPRKRPHSARAVVMGFEEIKNIDATKKAAVSQMSGGFNPLTAGKDKTEARRLLGQKKKKRKKNADVPFWQRIPFQVGALLGILGLTAFMMYQLIPNHQAMLEKAEAMVSSDDPDQWSDARIELKKVMDANESVADAAEQNGDDQNASFHAYKKAEEMFYQSKRKTLVFDAERGKVHRLQSENVQMFGKAFRMQEDGKDDDACDIYSELVASIDPEGSERHILVESKSRLKQLSHRGELPKQVDKLNELIGKAASSDSPGQLIKAHDLLARITWEFADLDGYEAVVALAAEELQKVKNKISAKDAPDSSDSTETESSFTPVAEPDFSKGQSSSKSDDTQQ